jgi:hypothetical protein
MYVVGECHCVIERLAPRTGYSRRLDPNTSRGPKTSRLNSSAVELLNIKRTEA